jgi:acyl-CoA hydrolase
MKKVEANPNEIIYGGAAVEWVEKCNNHQVMQLLYEHCVEEY